MLIKCFCKAAQLASVTGMGSVVGMAGGSARRGQSHNSEVSRLTSPSVGDLSAIMPRSTQGAWERNMRYEVSVAFWRVSNLRVSLLYR